MDEQELALVHVSPHVVTDARGRTYSSTVRAAQRDDGIWEGFVRFESGADVLFTGVETEQSNVDGLEYWARGLSVVYLEGALSRARDQLGPRS